VRARKALHRGHGYVRDHPIELWLRNARGFASFEGLAIV
jgi:acyl-CoA dehydrogenase